MTRSLDDIIRIEGGQVLATLIRLTGDIDRAEDALQDAVVVAAEVWARDGLPDSPGVPAVLAENTITLPFNDVEALEQAFAETKEVLGGFYLLDCKDLDEALKWAAQIPGAWHGRVEVRHVIDFSQQG